MNPMTTMNPTTTTAHRAAPPASARTSTSRSTTRGATIVARARINPKEPWWEKNSAPNMFECEDTGTFLNLLVRASRMVFSFLLSVFFVPSLSSRARFGVSPRLCSSARGSLVETVPAGRSSGADVFASSLS